MPSCCCCCGKSSFVLPKLQVFGDQEHSDALLLFSEIVGGPKEDDSNRFKETCCQLAELHARHPRNVEMLIPQLCGACSKLRPRDVDTMEAMFFIICSAESFHFAILCCLTLVGMVHDLQPQQGRRSSQNTDGLSAAPAAESMSQQRLMRLVHRICCAAVARSKGLADNHGVRILRSDRHFISESSFCALLLSDCGYGGLNFLSSIRDDIERCIGRSDGDALMASPDCAWNAPAWLSKSMQQRLRVMCDTMWLMSQCVGFSEQLRAVADRPSRRARLTQLLKVILYFTLSHARPLCRLGLVLIHLIFPQGLNDLLLQRSAYLPIAFSDAVFAVVARIPEADAHVFSTKARVPYLVALVQVQQLHSQFLAALFVA
jgi:hypothetical protein